MNPEPLYDSFPRNDGKRSAPLVSVEKNTDLYAATAKALSRLQLDNIAGKTVLLKVDAAIALPPEEGLTTPPAAIAAAVDFFRNMGAAEIAVGEGAYIGYDTEDVFSISGIKAVADEKKVGLLDFDKYPNMDLEPERTEITEKLSVTGYLKEFEILVSMPVFKTDAAGDPLLSLANLRGLSWRGHKLLFHESQAVKKGNFSARDAALAELASAVTPDIAVISNNSGLVIASTDAISADFTGAVLMGKDPATVSHLSLIAERRDLQPQYNVVPENYYKWRADYASEREKNSAGAPDFELINNRGCNSCLNCVYLFLNRYNHLIEKGEKLTFAIGREVSGCPDGTIYVGVCASSICKKEAATGGVARSCPPQAHMVADAYRKLKL